MKLTVGTEQSAPHETPPSVETPESKVMQLLRQGKILVAPVTLLSPEGIFVDLNGVLGETEGDTRVGAVYQRELEGEARTDGRSVQSVLIYTFGEHSKPVPLAVVEGQPKDYSPETLSHDTLIVKAVQETHLEPPESKRAATTPESTPLEAAATEEPTPETKFTDDVKQAETTRQSLLDKIVRLQTDTAKLPREAKPVLRAMFTRLEENINKVLDQTRIPVADLDQLRRESDEIRAHIRRWNVLKELEADAAAIKHRGFQSGLPLKIEAVREALAPTDAEGEPKVTEFDPSKADELIRTAQTEIENAAREAQNLSDRERIRKRNPRRKRSQTKGEKDPKTTQG